mmetsp:Transcript_12040/g.23208  ORF Transcript_12040/g.23208 Transcript_12040/m.23208 type:complete len:99 (-) Transcript_12040:37-333(-)
MKLRQKDNDFAVKNKHVLKKDGTETQRGWGRRRGRQNEEKTRDTHREMQRGEGYAVLFISPTEMKSGFKGVWKDRTRCLYETLNVNFDRFGSLRKSSS